jgi:hypothetical protein
MSAETEAAREVARTNFRAAVLSAFLGFLGVVAAAWIGAAVGKKQGRDEAKQQQGVQIAQRDDQITQLKTDVKALQDQIARANVAKPPPDVQKPGQQGAAADMWRDPQTGEGVTFTLHDCSRHGANIKCTFSLVANERDRYFLLWGTSRLIDTKGQEHLASSLALAGHEERVNRYGNVAANLVRAISIDGSVLFEGIPSEQNTAPLIELVTNGFGAQFRNVPLT